MTALPPAAQTILATTARFWQVAPPRSLSSATSEPPSRSRAASARPHEAGRLSVHPAATGQSAPQDHGEAALDAGRSR